MKYRTNINNSSACAIDIIDLCHRYNQLVRRSTGVENIRQIRLFLQNKPNFPHFSPENDELTQKQTQFKPNQSQFWADIKGGKTNTKPIKPNNQSSVINNQLKKPAKNTNPVHYWNILQVRGIMIRCGQEETGDFRAFREVLLLFTFGESILWIKGLFFAVLKLCLLLVF